jgi:hypothetical protein
MANQTGGSGNDTLTGTGDAEVLSGLAGNDTLNGAGGDDRLLGGTGDDIINGGAGIDTAVISGAMAGYRIQWLGGSFRIVDVSVSDGDQGSDTLTDVERVSFGDGTIGLNIIDTQFAEFRANTFTSFDQALPSIAGLNGGGYVIVWSSQAQDGNLRGIYGQRYDSSGAAAGTEVHISTEANNDQHRPSVGALEDGGYVVTWDSFLQDGSFGGIYAQRYGADGSAVGGEFRVNTTVLNNQQQSHVTGLGDGGFLVTWASNLTDGGGFGVYAQRYASSGAVVGSEFRVNTTTANDQQGPEATALAGGGFVVTWTSFGQDGSDNGVYARIYGQNGVAVGGEIQVSTQTNGEQIRSTAAALQDGGFVIAWESNGQDGSGDGIYAQHFNASGTKVGAEFRVNTTTANDQSAPAITVLANGNYVVVWQSDGQDGNSFGIVGRLFDENGAALGGEFNVNTGTANAQTVAQVAALADGGFVVSWQSLFQDGSDSGVYAQRFNADGNADTFVIEVEGNAGNNTLSLTGGTGRMIGLGGDDTYIVDSGADEVVEAVGGGTDTVKSEVSFTLSANVEQLLLTGTGNIDGTGNALNNLIVGNDGNNTLDGAGGNDNLRGGRGNDIYLVAAGDVVVEDVGAGTDWVLTEGDHTLAANVENLQILGVTARSATGNSGANQIGGGNGNDIISGAAGNDVLSGSLGDDHIRGGAGADRLAGGDGADLFIFGTLGESTVALAGRDAILDFDRTEGDKFQLTLIDADTDGTAGNQAFRFIARANFGGVDGQLRYAITNGNTIVYGDTNGDRTADFSFVIAGVHTLASTDFFL